MGELTLFTTSELLKLEAGTEFFDSTGIQFRTQRTGWYRAINPPGRFVGTSKIELPITLAEHKEIDHSEDAMWERFRELKDRDFAEVFSLNDYPADNLQAQSETINELRTISSTGGEKGQKLARFDLIPSHVLHQLAELYGRGASKYSARNWELGYEWSKSFAALMRHAWLFWEGEDNDQETELPHMLSVAFHAFALVHFMDNHPDFDDRPSSA